MRAARVALDQGKDDDALATERTSPRDEPNAAQVVKKNQIVPATGALTQARLLSSDNLRSWGSFLNIFGAFGPVLVAVVIISILWATWLIVLTIAPNATANYLMDTSKFDGGQFWLIVDPDHVLKALSVTGLVTVDLCYLALLLILGSSRAWNSTRETQWPRQLARVCKLYERIKASWQQIAGIRGEYRKFWNLVQKIGDLAMQSIMLGQLLEHGSSTLLVMGYAIFLCVNALSVAVTILVGNQSALHEILIDSLFDIIAAVLYPILVLLYSASNFDFDRELFSVNMEVLPPGSFESNARLFADPAERALFITSLDSLRILSFTDLVLRLSMNFSCCLRLFTVITLMVETSRTQKTIQSTCETLSKIFQRQRRVPRPVAVLFIGFAAAVVAYTHGSIAASHSACASFPECVVYAYQWGTGAVCSCKTLVSVYRSPQTYEEWEKPVDMYETVKRLSSAGTLQNLQLINRALTRWPEELHKCNDLQYISLIYTETESLPDWAKDWTNLRFLHIEGKQLRPSLTHLPDDLFSSMPHLQMLHLGVHPTLPRIPPLLGVPNLQSLTLAGLYAVTELPSFENVHKLESLTLALMESLQALPDMEPLKKLNSFMIFSICPACCNGFIGDCDPTDWFCMGVPDLGVSPSSCLAEDASGPTPSTSAMLKKFAPSICIRSGFDISRTVDLLSRAQVEVCGGVAYRRCEFPPGSGKIGICMNNRLQALMCMVNDDYIRLREVQIQRKLGPPCDAVEEAWLGCSS